MNVNPTVGTNRRATAAQHTTNSAVRSTLKRKEKKRKEKKRKQNKTKKEDETKKRERSEMPYCALLYVMRRGGSETLAEDTIRIAHYTLQKKTNENLNLKVSLHTMHQKQPPTSVLTCSIMEKNLKLFQRTSRPSFLTHHQEKQNIHS